MRKPHAPRTRTSAGAGGRAPTAGAWSTRRASSTAACARSSEPAPRPATSAERSSARRPPSCDRQPAASSTAASPAPPERAPSSCSTRPASTARPLPLVVMLHGCTQDPDDFAAGTRMNELAQEQGFFVLYPAQAPRSNAHKCWNWFLPRDQRRGHGEPALLAGMTATSCRPHAIDTDRVYVAGLSAGGAMAAILAREYPDLFAAAGVHSGVAAGAAHDVASAFSVMKSGPGAGASWPSAGATRWPTPAREPRSTPRRGGAGHRLPRRRRHDRRRRQRRRGDRRRARRRRGGRRDVVGRRRRRQARRSPHRLARAPAPAPMRRAWPSNGSSTARRTPGRAGPRPARSPTRRARCVARDAALLPRAPAPTRLIRRRRRSPRRNTAPTRRTARKHDPVDFAPHETRPPRGDALRPRPGRLCRDRRRRARRADGRRRPGRRRCRTAATSPSCAAGGRSSTIPLLARLVDAAEVASPTIASAAARIADARSRRAAAGAALLPSLDAGASAGRGRQDLSLPVGTSTSIGLQASWELDVFGGNRAARDAAEARVDGAAGIVARRARRRRRRDGEPVPRRCAPASRGSRRRASTPTRAPRPRA